MYGDPNAIRSVARRALDQAERLRDEATRTAALADVDWLSSGADRWRGELDELVAQLRRDADEVDQVAEALFAHADAAERTLDSIMGAMAAFERQLSDARAVLANGVDEVSAAAVSSARWVVDRARRAPRWMSMDWLSFW